MLLHVLIHDTYILYSSVFVSYSSGPLIGYLADVKFGRYKIIKFGSIVSFLTSILYFFRYSLVELLVLCSHHWQLS